MLEGECDHVVLYCQGLAQPIEAGSQEFVYPLVCIRPGVLPRALALPHALGDIHIHCVAKATCLRGYWN